MKHAALFLILWLLGSPVYATEIPSRIEINYHVITDIGEGEISEVMEIRHTGDHYRYSINSVAQATGMYKLIEPNRIVRHSEGFLTEQGLQPTRAYEKRGKKIPSLAVFDWADHSITLNHMGHEITTKLPYGTLDRLSLSYNFMFATLPKKHVERYVTNGHDVQLSRFTITEEILDTRLGAIKTIVLTRQEEQGSKLKRKLWLALNNHMLPVRIVSVEENGREIEKIVSGINIRYKPEQ